MTVITFSRQFASGGDAIAAQVCERLGYIAFDKKLMAEVAAEVGLCEHEVVDFSEDRYEVRSFLTRLFREKSRAVEHATVRQRDTSGKEIITTEALDEEQCIHLVRHTILSAYEKGSIVIVGRGGQAILRDKPGVLHVRVIAPLETRIQTMKQRGMSGNSEIKTLLAQHDRATAQYLRRFYGIEWDDPDLYHLIINAGLLTLEAAAEAIVAAAQQIRPQTAATP